MNDFQKIYGQAQQYFEEKKFVEAEMLFLQLLEQYPGGGVANIYNSIGFIRHQAGDYEKSISCYKKALELNPGYTEAALNLTIAYNDSEQYDEAARTFSNAAKAARVEGKTVDPFLQGKLANEHFKLGNTYFQVGCLDEAEEQYRKVLTMRPNFVDAMTHLGITLREKGSYTDAIASFRMALHIKADYKPAMIHLGITYYMNGFLDLALESWEKVKKINPDGKDVDVYLSLAKKKIIKEEEFPEAN